MLSTFFPYQLMCQSKALDIFADFDIEFCQIQKSELPNCQLAGLFYGSFVCRLQF